MNLVPEGIVGPLHRDQQLELLRNKLTGHKSFGFCRGNFHRDPDNLIKDDRSPTEVLRMWDERSKHIATMLSMLAKFKRNGWTTAYEELHKALVGSHVIEGETIPLEQTEPVTVVLFDPDISLSLIKWALTHEIEDLQKFAMERKDENLRDPVLGELYQRLPDMEEFLASWESSSFHPYWQGGCLVNSYSVFKEWIRTDLQEVLPHCAYHQTLLRLNECGQDKLLALHAAFGVILFGEDQKKVLSAVPRSKQERVSTWQFDIPSIIVRDMKGGGASSNYSFCLHPEDEHTRWKTMYPSLVSKGFQGGYGAVMVPRKGHWDSEVSRGYLLPSYRAQLPPDGVFRMMFNLYSHYDDGVH